MDFAGQIELSRSTQLQLVSNIYPEVAIVGKRPLIQSKKMDKSQLMNVFKNLRTCFLLGCVIAVLFHQAFTQSQRNAQETARLRDGQKDFDFEIGTWKTHLKRLKAPLSGSNEWVEYNGTTIVRKVWDGRANLVELDVQGSAGRIEALSLRLYDPQTRQWSLNFASARGGGMAAPTIGEFKNGRGEFYNQETYNGRSIFVRFIISDITPDSVRFEQAFSEDGGKTWEVNWIAVDTRVRG